MKNTNLDFDGMASCGCYKESTKYSGNKSGLKARENYGSGPKRAGTTGDHAGPSTAQAGGRINGGATVKCPANPDKINVGK